MRESKTHNKLNINKPCAASYLWWWSFVIIIIYMSVWMCMLYAMWICFVRIVLENYPLLFCQLFREIMSARISTRDSNIFVFLLLFLFFSQIDQRNTTTTDIQWVEMASEQNCVRALYFKEKKITWAYILLKLKISSLLQSLYNLSWKILVSFSFSHNRMHFFISFI